MPEEIRGNPPPARRATRRPPASPRPDASALIAGEGFSPTRRHGRRAEHHEAQRIVDPVFAAQNPAGPAVQA